MFVDIAEVVVKAGNGGNGVVSFRHEIYVDRGGPDGGDGGDGGSVYFEATNNINALQSFRYKQLLQAKEGSSGAKQKKHGRNGADHVVKVPIGTVVLNHDGKVLADLSEDGQKELIATGGKGGFGNAHFKSSRRQAPKIAEVGEKTKQVELRLELKLLADVGLVGLPNAGKSTFLGKVSNAKPEVANYPFTTLRPHLGVVDILGEKSLLIADIPGLIEGASEGKGLGDEFLRHIERTEVLLHLIDSYSSDIAADFLTIRKELADYQVDLSKKPFVVALTKTDGLDADIVADQMKALGKVHTEQAFAISSHDSSGIDQLLRTLSTLVESHRAQSIVEEAETPEASGYTMVTIEDDGEAWDVNKIMEQVFEVSGEKIESFASRTDFNNEWGVARLKDIMKKKGILHDLIRKGATSGDTIKIGDSEMEL